MSAWRRTFLYPPPVLAPFWSGAHRHGFAPHVYRPLAEVHITLAIAHLPLRLIASVFVSHLFVPSASHPRFPNELVSVESPQTDGVVLSDNPFYELFPSHPNGTYGVGATGKAVIRNTE